MNNLEFNDGILDAPNVVLLEDPDGDEFVSNQVEEIQGLEGDDTIVSALNPREPGSTLFGNAGNDYIRSRGVGDRVFGGVGNDTIINESGKALIYGESDSDYLLARESQATLFGGRGFEEASAEDGENLLISEGGQNILVGGGGNDTLIGKLGRDTIAGGNGDDSIVGGPQGENFLFGNQGEDIIISKAKQGPDTMFGGRGNDSILVDASSTADRPELFGGVGDDTLMVMGSVNGAILVADINPDGTFGGSEGDQGNNYLFVESGSSHELFGNAGNDTLELGSNVAGEVSMFGGAGNDVILGGSEASYSDLKIFGGEGNDTIMFQGSVSQSVIWGDNESIEDGFGNNVIMVGGDSNTLRGGNDNTTAENAGKNKITLLSGSGNLVIGGPGGDFLSGSAAGANNTLQGGVGNDTFFFGKNQKIISGGGVNVYRGIGAGQGEAVEVNVQDVIGGDGNFVIRGNASGFHEIQKGGIRTPDTDKRQNITITVDASGTTRTGAGADIFELGSVSGLVTSDAGNNVFNVQRGVSGAVKGGSGNDVINVKGAVFEGGSVSGGLGNDSIFANVVKSGGLIYGGEGSDTLRVNQLFGQVKGGGAVKNVFQIQTAHAGAEIFAGRGNEQVTLAGIGTTDEADGRILIQGSSGDNFLGFSYTGERTRGIASNMARLEINGFGGKNIIQGTPFGNDILKGGFSTDVLYGGASAFTGENANPDDLTLTIGDGDKLISGGGRTTFLFKSWNETAKVQRSFTNIALNEAPEDGINDFVISIGTGPGPQETFLTEQAGSIYESLQEFGSEISEENLQGATPDADITEDEDLSAILGFWNEGSEAPTQEEFSEFLESSEQLSQEQREFLGVLEITGGDTPITSGFDENGENFVSAGFHVDTLTNFAYEDGRGGDRIYLDSSQFGDFVNLNARMTQFESDGFLFGAIKAGGTDAETPATEGNYFNTSVVAGVGSGAEMLNNAIQGGERVQSFLFDKATGGLYLSPNEQSAYLVAVLEDHNIPADRENIAFESIFEVGPVDTLLEGVVTF